MAGFSPRGRESEPPSVALCVLFQASCQRNQNLAAPARALEKRAARSCGLIWAKDRQLKLILL